MSSWNLVHESKSDTGTARVFQDDKGNVRIDSYMGDVRDKDDHDRLTLNTKDGGNISGHGFNHSQPFDTSRDNSKSNTKSK